MSDSRPFVQWPTDAFPDPTAPLAICVLGTDPFGSALDGCYRLFIAHSERRRLPALIERLRGSRRLTVGEADDFTEQGGIVGLAATVPARLNVSARLMALAWGARKPVEPQP